MCERLLLAAGGSCPAGFAEYEGMCYFVNPAYQINNDDAIAYCEGNGTHIASITVRWIFSTAVSTAVLK